MLTLSDIEYAKRYSSCESGGELEHFVTEAYKEALKMSGAVAGGAVAGVVGAGAGAVSAHGAAASEIETGPADAVARALQWLVKETHTRTNHARMLVGEEEGNLLKVLAKRVAAKHILEIGTFTGYSAICLASGAIEGVVDAIEINDELEYLIREAFERAGVAKNINLIIGDAKKVLPQLANNLYDVVFIDANKREYCRYYNLVFEMVRPGGLILADNVLWSGKAAEAEAAAAGMKRSKEQVILTQQFGKDRDESSALHKSASSKLRTCDSSKRHNKDLNIDSQTRELLSFNKMVKEDRRVENFILPIRDGLNVIRKKLYPD